MRLSAPKPVSCTLLPVPRVRVTCFFPTMPWSSRPVSSWVYREKRCERPASVSCSEASWRFPAGWGPSFAGWNTLISIFLVLAALSGALKRYGSSSVSQ